MSRAIHVVAGHRCPRLICALSIVSLALCGADTSRAQGQHNSLLAYAVNIQMRSGTGVGIYLGGGLFITAAHVVGHGWISQPKIVIAGKAYPTQIVKEGSFEGTDLTLLSVEEGLLPIRLALRRNALCAGAPRPGQQVVTVIPGAVVRSHILAPDQLPASVKRFSTVIADVARTGNSGSGVFDAQRGCLLGIMSRKISQALPRTGTGKTETRDIAKYFVPAAEISEFLPAGPPR